MSSGEQMSFGYIIGKIAIKYSTSFVEVEVHYKDYLMRFKKKPGKACNFKCKFVNSLTYCTKCHNTRPGYYIDHSSQICITHVWCWAIVCKIQSRSCKVFQCCIHNKIIIWMSTFSTTKWTMSLSDLSRLKITVIFFFCAKFRNVF